MKTNIVKFISWDHVFVVLMCTLVMTMFSSNPANNIRFIDWLMMYGVLLANVRAIRSAQ